MLNEQLEKLYKKNNTTQTKTAKELNIKTQNFTNWKNGSLPSLETTIKLSKYFNVSIDYLLFGKEEINLTEEEKEILKNWRDLNEREKGKIELLYDQIIKKRKE